jgi:uncharacterized membrane protein
MDSTPARETAPPERISPGRLLRRNIQANMVAGVLTLIPVVVTYVVFDFLLGILSRLGDPIVGALKDMLEPGMPELSAFLENALLRQTVAVILIILAIYFIGLAATQVVGARLIALGDRLINRIPLVRQVYGSVKALLNVLQQRPSNTVQRVVMIEFPHSEMKTVGLVTRTMTDEVTGRELAAVFVPTTPNPTGGYLEVVPVDRLVSTDWTLDEAMNFVISGGAVSRDRIAFSKSTPRKPAKPV